jgi:uncharacterized protein (TIGR03382 family)
MAFSITTKQTVLWDQIRYSGDPSEFAWVLPVRSGARVELSRDEWFAALDASTQPVVIFPNSGASGCALAGCASSDNSSAPGAGGSVQVLAQNVVGPYETVTLRATDANALVGWLEAHSFALPPAIRPTVDAYVAEGFDFIALRLRPQCSERSMKPVRVVTPGADPTLPLRMVAAGVGANIDILLYVVGEGRWRPQNFPEVLFDDSQLRSDPVSYGSSNYESVAQLLMGQHGGTSWLTEAASQPDLGGWYPGHPESSGLVSGSSRYSTGAGGASNPGLAPTYFAFCRGTGIVPGTTSTVTPPQPCPVEAGIDAGVGNAADAETDGPAADGADTGAEADADGADDGAETGANADADGTDADSLSDAAGDGPESDASDGADAADAADGDDALAIEAGTALGDAGTQPRPPAAADPCAGFDDIDVALDGAHPQDVWVTRLRARLPVYALANDLRIEASPAQVSVSNVHQVPAQTSVGSRQGCAAGTRPNDAFGTGALVSFTVLGVGALLRRRR